MSGQYFLEKNTFLAKKNTFLEKKNIKCLLIEAGGENYSEISQEFYKGKIIGDQITDLSLSRLRQFGGTSGHWGGWSKPMEKYNFELWPLGDDELNPYSKKIGHNIITNGVNS